MMSDRPIPYRRFFYLDLFLCLFATVVGTLAFLFSYDRSVGYFNAGPFPTLLYCALFAGVGIAIVFALWKKGNVNTEIPNALSSKNNMMTRIAAWLNTAAFATAGMVSVWQLMSDTVPQTGALSKPVTGWLALLTALSALASAVYFASVGLCRNAVSLFRWTGLGVTGYAVLATIRAYFDLSVPMNAPTKLLAQFSLLSIALCHIAELWALSGVRTVRRLRVLGLLALPLCFGYTLPMLLTIPAYGTALLDASTWFALLPQLAYAIYLATRLYSLDDNTASSDHSDLSDLFEHSDHPDHPDNFDKEASSRG